MLRVIIPVIGGNDEDDADDDDDDDNEDARTSEAMYPTLTSCQYPGAHHPRQAPPRRDEDASATDAGCHAAPPGRDLSTA